MKVLVTGASGFIASAIIERLLSAGHRVIACARSRRNLPSSPALHFQPVDLFAFTSPEAWRPLLDGVDVVINCAGILTEQDAGDFDVIHSAAPKALAEACRELGIRRFIQISALGTEQDGEFIASKHRFDAYLLQSDLTAWVIRPSVVLSLRGSYGGTSLLRMMAGLPWVCFLPGKGEQRIQPILLEDLAALVLHSLDRMAGRQLLYAVGPEELTLKDYVSQVRAWLKFPPPWFVPLPMWLMRAVTQVGERLKMGPLGKTIWVMLQHGNVAPAGAYSELIQTTGHEPASVRTTLQQSASFVQDRWHARLYLLRPIIWLTLVFVWLLSGVAGFLATPDEFRPVLSQLNVPAAYQTALVWSTSLLDVLLGSALLLRYRMRAVLGLMAASVLGYTVLLGMFAPGLWLEPLGSLLKNLPILVLIAVMLVLEDMR